MRVRSVSKLKEALTAMENTSNKIPRVKRYVVSKALDAIMKYNCQG